MVRAYPLQDPRVIGEREEAQRDPRSELRDEVPGGGYRRGKRVTLDAVGGVQGKDDVERTAGPYERLHTKDLGPSPIFGHRDAIRCHRPVDGDCHLHLRVALRLDLSDVDRSGGARGADRSEQHEEDCERHDRSPAPHRALPPASGMKSTGGTLTPRSLSLSMKWARMPVGFRWPRNFPCSSIPAL